MFFIGIFGIDQRNKVILTKQNVICPVCGAFGRYSIVKTYSCFHTFFIPLWRWNTRYFVECHCCKKLCALDKDIGDRIEKGEGVEIHKVECYHKSRVAKRTKI